MSVVVVSVSTAGWTMMTPFLSIHLRTDLLVTDVRTLAFWTGVCSGIAPITVALLSPVWGAVGDRRGKKMTLLVSVAGAALFTPLVGLSRTPLELAIGVFLVGICGGIVPAAVAMSATSSPRERVSLSLGFIYAGRAIGQAAGPLLGAIAIALAGFRIVAVALGVLYGVVLGAAALALNEAPQRVTSRGAIWRTPAGLTPTARRTLTSLLICAFTTQLAVAGAQQMIVVRLIGMVRSDAAPAAGVAFAALSVCAAITAGLYAAFSNRLPFKTLCVTTLLILAVGLTTASIAAVPWMEVLAAGVIGAAYGVVSPGVNTVVGLIVPHHARATIFGLSTGAFSLGNGTGPILCGLLAGFTDPRFSLIAAAAIDIVGALALMRGVDQAFARRSSQQAVSS
jgi:DHA1 family multidrug resistance protein-like MFS transporter